MIMLNNYCKLLDTTTFYGSFSEALFNLCIDCREIQLSMEELVRFMVEHILLYYYWYQRIPILISEKRKSQHFFCSILIDIQQKHRYLRARGDVQNSVSCLIVIRALQLSERGVISERSGSGVSKQRNRWCPQLIRKCLCFYSFEIISQEILSTSTEGELISLELKFIHADPFFRFLCLFPLQQSMSHLVELDRFYWSSGHDYPVLMCQLLT